MTGSLPGGPDASTIIDLQRVAEPARFFSQLLNDAGHELTRQ